MNELLSILNADLLAATLRLSTPITLAAVGAVVCERSGIINIAMEGLMLFGAFFAAYVTLVTGNPWLGMLGGVFAGGLLSLLHAWASITLHLNQVISGAVINILAFGATRFLMVLCYGHPGTSDPVPVSLGEFRWAIPLLAEIPFFGRVLFNQTPIVYLSLILVVLLAWMMKRTTFGLHVRAVGEHPLALETLGRSVKRIRYTAVLISGLLSGLAGAYLAIENGRSFTEGMTGGRGFIALAANISGGWNAIGAFLASIVFGFVDALQLRFQVVSTLDIPSELFLVFPYLITVIAVAGLVKRSRAPGDLGNDFRIERDAD